MIRKADHMRSGGTLCFPQASNHHRHSEPLGAEGESTPNHLSFRSAVFARGICLFFYWKLSRILKARVLRKPNTKILLSILFPKWDKKWAVYFRGLDQLGSDRLLNPHKLAGFNR